jgi:hypothetical protein
MRPSLVRPEIKRGARFDYGPPPAITPEYLRPGVDVLKLRVAHAAIPQWSLVLYVGHTAGEAAVAVPAEKGGWRVVLVPGEDVDEAFLLVDDLSPEWHEFREGHEVGRWEALSEREVGQQSRGRQPTWFGRGVVAGWEDRMKGVHLDWSSDLRQFNTLIRRLPPHELPPPLPWERRGEVSPRP